MASDYDDDCSDSMAARILEMARARRKNNDEDESDETDDSEPESDETDETQGDDQ